MNVLTVQWAASTLVLPDMSSRQRSEGTWPLPWSSQDDNVAYFCCFKESVPLIVSEVVILVYCLTKKLTLARRLTTRTYYSVLSFSFLSHPHERTDNDHPTKKIVCCFISTREILITLGLEKPDFILVWSILVGETSPDPRRTETFSASITNGQHPNSQPPHTSTSVQNCALSPTTSSQ